MQNESVSDDDMIVHSKTSFPMAPDQMFYTPMEIPTLRDHMAPVRTFQNTPAVSFRFSMKQNEMKT